MVGPEGEEIFCDKYGRVKVQFLWDRQGQLDANSSCWLRVAQPLAGQGWGMISIPRIGQEVVVAFLEGDPDRPIITGSVYNAEQMPPFTLPDYRTKSAIKTHSYNKGHQNNFHGMAFEDTKGSEHLQIHSEKDMAITVEHDHRVHVPNNHITTVGGVFQVKSADGGSGSGGGAGSGSGGDAGSGSGGDAGSGSGGDDAQSQPAWTVNPSPTQALGQEPFLHRRPVVFIRHRAFPEFHLRVEVTPSMPIPSGFWETFPFLVPQGLRTTFPWVFWGFHGKYKIFTDA